MSPEDFPPLPPRPHDADKSMMGSVWVVGASPGLSGAALLATHAALRGGCGRATVAIPDRCASAAEEQKPLEAMSWSPGDGQSHWTQSSIEKLLATARADSWVIGCGIGRQSATTRAIEAFLASRRVPSVIDADGLWHLCQAPELLQQLGPDTILTPHPGELNQLREALDLKGSSREDLSSEVHRITSAIVVAKGPETITTGSAGIHHNNTGNPGMATAGSGDVLAGLIGALLARGDEPALAARRGVWLHGRAADLAVQQQGEESLIAGDIIAALGKAFIEHCAMMNSAQ
ncbi:MAG: NAD(P)H-hydrate dehydratase [Planctomycetota bacterium]